MNTEALEQAVREVTARWLRVLAEKAKGRSDDA